MIAPVLAVAACALALLGTAPLRAETIPVVAAENFYGDVAQQIGGSAITVTSILTNPEQDPHLFEASASTARAVAGARIVIYNGLDYDPWMAKLLAAHKASNRKVIVAAGLLKRKTGDNPHLWYEPGTMPAVAVAFTELLVAADPAHRTDFEQRRDGFLASLAPVTAKIGAIRQRYANTAVTATEPVFGYMADALGFTMRNRRFQMAVMNETEPSAKDVAAFENDLRSRAVKILFYNKQTSDDLTARLQRIAREAKLAVVGVTETQPPNTRFQDWMMRQLDEVERALAQQPS